MALDDNVDAASIGVKTKDGRVTLSGTVKTEDERRRAVQLAKETKGVLAVDDRLTLTRKPSPGLPGRILRVRPPPGSAAPATSPKKQTARR